MKTSGGIGDKTSLDQLYIPVNTIKGLETTS